MSDKELVEIPFEEPLPKPHGLGWKEPEDFDYYINQLNQKYDFIPNILFDLLKDSYELDKDKFKETFYKTYDKELIEYSTINYDDLKKK
jgi:hypothetical protein